MKKYIIISAVALAAGFLLAALIFKGCDEPANGGGGTSDTITIIKYIYHYTAFGGLLGTLTLYLFKHYG